MQSLSKTEAKVIDYLYTQSQDLYAAEIGRRLNIRKRTVYDTLDSLKRKGIVQERVRGRMKFYKLTDKWKEIAEAAKRRFVAETDEGFLADILDLLPKEMRPYIVAVIRRKIIILSNRIWSEKRIPLSTITSTEEKLQRASITVLTERSFLRASRFFLDNVEPSEAKIAWYRPFPDDKPSIEEEKKHLVHIINILKEERISPDEIREIRLKLQSITL